ncbi:hypothetical protein ACXR6G_03810 [Ancylomarina sp. YFZ004]
MKNKILLALRILVAIILVQTLWFKFSAHPDSVYIFTQVGMEPYGRIGIGALELIASVLILIPRTIWLGSGLVLGIIGGAIMMHLTQLGVEINGDSGKLFYMSIITFVLSSIVLFYHRKDIPIIGKMFFENN